MLIFTWPYKMLNVKSCEYMDSEIHAYPNTSGGQKLCKENKSHPSFSSKLFELIPKSGVTHSPTMKAMALSLLNSPHCFKIHDHVILMVKPSAPKASLSVVIALTTVPSFAYLSNQSAADMAEDNGPSQCNRISFIWERTFSNCNFVPSLQCDHKGIDVHSSW